MKLWDEVFLHRVSPSIPQASHICECLQSFTFKEPQELLRVLSRDLLLLPICGNCKISSSLQISSVNLFIFAISSFLKSLSLYKHSFFFLLENSLLFFQLESLIIFDNFHPSMLNGFTDQDLKNWLSCNFEIKQTLLFVIQLNSFIITVLVWNKLSSSWLIDIEISWNRIFIYHIILIIQSCPIVIPCNRALELLLLLFDLVKSSLLSHLSLLLCYLLLQLLLLFEPF